MIQKVRKCSKINDKRTELLREGEKKRGKERERETRRERKEKEREGEGRGGKVYKEPF